MMHISFKQITSGFALILSCSFSYAQTFQWPTKPKKYVVPFAPGGVSDSISRLIAQNLSVKLE